MRLNIVIQQLEDPPAEDKAYVSKQFIAYNNKQCGILPSKDLYLFAYDPEGQIFAGLFGDISWGWLHVDTLWVAESYQQHGIGFALMERAEAEARAMDMAQAYL
jgi:GNAT superfamily N-acetyltransferase